MTSSAKENVVGVIIDQPVGNANELGAPKGPKPNLIPPGFQDWTATVCGCCSDNDWCCYALCCYCCLITDLSVAMKEHWCLPCLPWCGLLALRIKMRLQYGIKGDACSDCRILCFCNGCVACQMYREGIELGILPKKRCSDSCKSCCVCYI